MNRRGLVHVASLVALLALVAPFVVYAVPQAVGASQSYVVLSDSMSPDVRAGDVVVVDDATAVEEGDVITFQRSTGDQLVTHRVVDVVQQDGQTLYRTKGDANEEADRGLVASEDVVGTVSFHIPFVGHVVLFAQSPLGIAAFVVVPAILLAADELYRLYSEAFVEVDAGSGVQR